MTTYEDFKALVKETLVGKTLTWTEVRTSAKLPQLFPNNQWVRKLETDIALERKKDAHGIIHWSLKADAAAQQTKPAKLNTKAAGRK